MKNDFVMLSIRIFPILISNNHSETYTYVYMRLIFLKSISSIKKVARTVKTIFKMFIYSFIFFFQKFSKTFPWIQFY